MGDVFRRSGERKQARVGTVVKVTYRAAGRFCTNFAENISSGGMFIATSRPLPPGTTMTLEFFSPGSSQPLKAKARVVWVRTRLSAPGSKRGMGVQFMELDETEKARIKEIVDELKQKN
jgi:uncharacterized protein (TIGR02266 family)